VVASISSMRVQQPFVYPTLHVSTEVTQSNHWQIVFLWSRFYIFYAILLLWIGRKAYRWHGE